MKDTPFDLLLINPTKAQATFLTKDNLNNLVRYNCWPRTLPPKGNAIKFYLSKMFTVVQQTLSKWKSLKSNCCLIGTTSSDMIGFIANSATSVHLPVNGTPAEQNIFSQSLQVSFNESLP